MKHILFAFIFLAGANAFADISGNWIGDDGQVSGSVMAPCSRIQIAISETPSFVTIHTGDYTCGGLSIYDHTYDFSVDGSNLYFDGELVGQIGFESLSFTINGDSATDAESFDMFGDTINYRAEYNMDGMRAGVTSSLRRW